MSPTRRLATQRQEGRAVFQDVTKIGRTAQGSLAVGVEAIELIKNFCLVSNTVVSGGGGRIWLQKGRVIITQTLFYVSTL